MTARTNRFQHALNLGRISICMCASFATIGGCAANPDPGLGYKIGHAWNNIVAGHVQEVETFTVPADGVLNVEVDNFAGHVVVYRDANATTGSIKAIRRGTHGLGHVNESQHSLEEISVTYDLESRGDRQAIVVHTTTTHSQPWFQSVDLEIIVPRLGLVIVRTKQGSVKVTDFEDGVDIESASGNVRAATNSPITAPSTILNKDGSINWRVPPNSAGSYQMEAVNGEVRRRVRSGKWVSTDSRNDHDSSYAILNNGTNLVILRTVEGDIRVFVGKDPTETGSFID